MTRFFSFEMGKEPAPTSKPTSKPTSLPKNGADKPGLVPVLCKLATAAIVVGGFFFAFNQQTDPRQAGLRTE